MVTAEYNIYIDGNKIGKCISYNEAIDYIEENYSHMLPFLVWEPSLNVDCWANGMNSIMIEKSYKTIDIKILISDYQKKSKKYSREEESDKDSDGEELYDKEVQKKMAFTPKRTNLKTKKKKRVSVQKEGEIMEGEDGKLYISKKKTNGKMGWTRYTEKKYQGAPKKKSSRKCPKKPAKEFKENHTMKGEDGNIWKVKKIKNGTFRWVKQN